MLKMVGDERHGNPRADEFTGEWPREFKALVRKGCFDPLTGELFNIEWDLVQCRHISKTLLPYIDCGKNEHGVQFVAKSWFKLEGE